MNDSSILIQTLQDYLTKKCKDFKLAIYIVLIVCFGILLFGVFLPAGNDQEEIIWKSIILGFAALGAIGIAIWGRKELKKYDPEDCKLLEVIQTQNKEKYVVWIYPHILTTKQYGKVIRENYSVIFKCNDKEEYQIPLPNGEHVKYITMLQIALPNVTYGFSEERKKEYQKDPKLLLKE